MVATELLHWLLRLAASPDTLTRCHRIVADELRHAELAWGLHQLQGGAGPAPVPEEWTAIPHAPGQDLLHRTLATLVCEYALSETVATALFRRFRRLPLRPEVAPVVARIVRDEATHSAFGWFALEELLPRAPDGAAWISTELPTWIRVFEAQFERIGETPSPEAVSWGTLPGSEYRAIVRRTLSRVVAPRLGRLGVVWPLTPPNARTPP